VTTLFVRSGFKACGLYLLLSCAMLFGATTNAHAQGFISPLIGYDYGGDSGCPQLTGCEDKHLNIGVSFGAIGSVFGFEAELADARNFFGEAPNQESSVITLMGNLMLIPALGPLHPYAVGGIGLIKTNVDFTVANLVATDNNALGWDLGGGAIVFFSEHVGVRGDVRHFHSFEKSTIPVVGSLFEDEHLNFGRASGALVFRF